MKKQAQQQSPMSGQIQWDAFPSHLLYKVDPDNAKALQEWWNNATFAINRRQAELQDQIDALKSTGQTTKP